MHAFWNRISHDYVRFFLMTRGRTSCHQVKTTYGNSQTSHPGYALGRIISTKYNRVTAYRYYYNSKGEPSSSSYTTPDSGLVKTVYTYGNYNTDSGERVLKKLNLHSSRFIIDYDYDGFYWAGNTITLSSGASLATTYAFRAGSADNTTSVMPRSQTQVMKDQNGNTTDTLTTSYTYDGLGNTVKVLEEMPLDARRFKRPFTGHAVLLGSHEIAVREALEREDRRDVLLPGQDVHAEIRADFPHLKANAPRGLTGLGQDPRPADPEVHSCQPLYVFSISSSCSAGLIRHLTTRRPRWQILFFFRSGRLIINTCCFSLPFTIFYT